MSRQLRFWVMQHQMIVQAEDSTGNVPSLALAKDETEEQADSSAALHSRLAQHANLDVAEVVSEADGKLWWR